MMEDDILTLMNEQRAKQACVACRKQKRKCDKDLPACTACRRTRKPCDYSTAKPDDVTWLRQRLDVLEQKLAYQPMSTVHDFEAISLSSSDASGVGTYWNPPIDLKERPINNFPSIFFLDSAASLHTATAIPRPLISVPQVILSNLGSIGDIENVAETYFHTTHIWLPIIWKRRFLQQFINPYFQPGPDMALLLACMKLTTLEPPTVSPQPYLPACEPLYVAVKQFLLTAESAGLLSVEILQATILVALYELGHAIYPAAYLTVGRTARIGQLMGMHDKKYSGLVNRKLTSWGEMEEVRRVWFAVIILDRHCHINLQSQPLCSGDFTTDEVLPSSTLDWDEGSLSPSQPLFVLSAPSLPASPYARYCQVAHLLGRMISHRDDRTLDSEQGSFRFSSAAQLHRTFDALLQLLWREFPSNRAALSAPLAMAFSGKMALLDVYACTGTNRGMNSAEETDMQDRAISGMKGAPSDVRQFVRAWLFRGSPMMNPASINTATSNGGIPSVTDATERSSTPSLDQLIPALINQPILPDMLASTNPLVCDCLYQAAATAAWFVNENGDRDMAECLAAATQGLKLLDRRWKVAGEYLKILETMQQLARPG